FLIHFSYRACIPLTSRNKPPESNNNQQPEESQRSVIGAGPGKFRTEPYGSNTGRCHEKKREEPNPAEGDGVHPAVVLTNAPWAYFEFISHFPTEVNRNTE